MPDLSSGLAGGGRRPLLGALVGGLLCFKLPGAEAQMSPKNASVQSPSDDGPAYSSPYALSFTLAQPLLDAGFDQAPWNDPGAEAAEPFAIWQAQHAAARGAAWGPPARQYPAPQLPRADEDYLRQRVLRVAARHIGLAYQHHHLPSWQPPAAWPWLPVKLGTNGAGLDCSNFSSFVFNYALGLKLPTGIGLQARSTRLPGPGGQGCLRVERIETAGRDNLGALLQPADLLYFRSPGGAIRHVAFWLGAVGEGDMPLVLDCTQQPHVDATGAAIPAGVQIRPLTPGGWYARRLAHAHRLIGAAGPGCARAPAALPEGDDRA